uniref:GLUG domain-containing protein n=1 Tax=Candidatus Methanophagaceae archaeon ANME-1 ERB6 TaxID=2759912 RepID=A0A7G9YUH5_9EURY|nr:hypothetical protein IGDPAKFA_00013 [Methanosarcinales archaeon ANME-1 ERB6]
MKITALGLAVLTILVVTTLLSFLPQPAQAQTPITTCTELQNIRNDLSRDYYLANAIDCSCTSGWNGGAGFEPIGTSSSKFTGTFDGNGYKITHLYINRSSTNHVGLFGYTGSGSEIKDVGLEEVNVNGNWYVGGLVGDNYGTITNSYSSGSVSGSAVVGGLAGFSSGEITNSYSSGSVSGYLGVGGLVASNGGTITNSYYPGSVTGSPWVGGLVGDNGGTITNSYYPGDDITCTGCDNLIGNTTKANLQNETWLTTPPNNWDFDTIWGIVEGVTYPYMWWQYAPKITSFAPPSPVNDTVCTWTTFNVTEAVPQLFINTDT